jgi:hypothetical protein
MKFYQNLLKIIPGSNLVNAKWSICNIFPVDSNDNSYKNLISYIWWIDDNYLLIVVNYSVYPSKGHVKIESLDYGSDNWVFKDMLTQNNYIYKGTDLEKYGLYIDLKEWNSHIFNIKKEIH